MQRVIVAAPFGNYLRFKGTTRTLGTYTVPSRAGFLKRFWRGLTSIRYNPLSQSWLNRMRLANPGIAKAPKQANDCILSVYGFDEGEWVELVQEAHRMGVEAVELNLSCPNIEHRRNLVRDVGRAIHWAAGRLRVIAKLPPVRWMDFGKPLYSIGVRHYNLCNTIPTPGGGMSGKPLMQYSLWAIEDFRDTFGDSVTLIGGGGITCLDDVKAYMAAGANHVSLASMLFNPFNWYKVGGFVEYLEGLGLK
jgi:dihydroorotate dehydrogenase